MSDPNAEDELVLAVMKELRRRGEREDQLCGLLEQIREVVVKVTDVVVLVNQTCVRVAVAVEQVEARMRLLPTQEPL